MNLGLFWKWCAKIFEMKIRFKIYNLFQTFFPPDCWQMRLNAVLETPNWDWRNVRRSYGLQRRGWPEWKKSCRKPSELTQWVVSSVKLGAPSSVSFCLDFSFICRIFIEISSLKKILSTDRVQRLKCPVKFCWSVNFREKSRIFFKIFNHESWKCHWIPRYFQW